jgi:hypothetical protein
VLLRWGRGGAHATMTTDATEACGATAMEKPPRHAPMDVLIAMATVLVPALE